MLNQIFSRMNQPEPKVGLGATVLAYTDRYAGTIIKVWTKGKSKYITIQRDASHRTDNNNMSDCQSYDYKPDANGVTWTFKSLDGKPSYEVKYNDITNKWNRYEGGLRLLIGHRNEYYDYTF